MPTEPNETERQLVQEWAKSRAYERYMRRDNVLAIEEIETIETEAYATERQLVQEWAKSRAYERYMRRDNVLAIEEIETIETEAYATGLAHRRKEMETLEAENEKLREQLEATEEHGDEDLDG